MSPGDPSRHRSRPRVLAHERLAAGPNGSAAAWFLHGIYGSRQNWRGVARRVIERRRDWAAVLVDLRMHGESHGFHPPHDLAACAMDLEGLAERIGPPAVLVGHSFGGKVALVYGQRHASGLRQLWVVDASPARRPLGGGAHDLLRLVRSLPDSFSERRDGVRAMVERGVPPPVARWMAMNLVREGGGYRWRLEMDAIESLLRDFHETDAWPVVSSPPEGCEIRFIRASRSEALSDQEFRRIQRLERESTGVRAHRIEGGHWLTADAPEELARLLADELPPAARAGS